jgi:hypothetical protein
MSRGDASDSYLGWQESLRNLARLVEADIQDQWCHEGGAFAPGLSA